MLLKVVIAIHLIVSFVLVVTILLHAGRGGGLSSAFGGGMPETLTGSTIMERNLDRITIAAAIIFGITSILLTFIYHKV